MLRKSATVKITYTGNLSLGNTYSKCKLHQFTWWWNHGYTTKSNYYHLRHIQVDSCVYSFRSVTKSPLYKKTESKCSSFTLKLKNSLNSKQCTLKTPKPDRWKSKFWAKKTAGSTKNKFSRMLAVACSVGLALCSYETSKKLTHV